MQIGTVQGVKFNTQDPFKVKNTEKPTQNASASTLKGDSVTISTTKRITMNTLKGAGVGVVAGAAGGAGATAAMLLPVLIKGGEGAGWGLLGAATMGVGGAVIGGATGAVVANVTKNKTAGAILGAVAGGAFAGLTRGDLTSTVVGAASGGLAGYFAAKVAK